MAKILFLTISDRKGASSRYRIYQYVPFLQDAGYDIKVMPPNKNGKGLVRLIKGMADESACLKAAQEADIVFIQKRLYRIGFLKKLAKLGKKIVFDLDDSIFTSPKGEWSRLTRKKVLARFGMTLKISDLVVTGNGFLRGYAIGAGARRVEVIPTAVDMAKYPKKEHVQGRSIVLGWIGSSVNHRYLRMLDGILPGLAKEIPGLELLVVSDKDFVMDGVNVINRRWSEETEADDLLKMDIGLMPLADDEWTRGKCALKALQYMACGIPAVCSSVGANNDVIDNGVDGFLASDAEEWVSALKELISSPKKREAIGWAARKNVERFYNISVLVPLYVELLASLFGSEKNLAQPGGAVYAI